MPRRRNLTDAAAMFVKKGPTTAPVVPPARTDTAMLSARVPVDVAKAVRLLAVTNEVAGKQPASVQAVVIEAITTWLAAQKTK